MEKGDQYGNSLEVHRMFTKLILNDALWNSSLTMDHVL
jgi:hypothetical protein